MGGSVRLHKEHGVNPSIEVCYFCGDDIGIALLGASCKTEAPRNINLGHACERCQSIVDSGGVFIFEANGPEPEQRTGRMVGITQEASQRIFGDEYQKNNVLQMDPEAFEKLGFGDACKKEVG